MQELLRSLLPELAIFGGLAEDELDKVMTLLEWRTFEKGDVIARQGDIGSVMYIVGRGQCDVTVEVGDGAEPLVLATVGPGACLGEMALIDIKPRSASIRAASSCGLFLLTNSDFLHLYEWNLHTYTLMVLNVARELSRRLRRSNQVITACARALRDGLKD